MILRNNTQNFRTTSVKEIKIGVIPSRLKSVSPYVKKTQQSKTKKTHNTHTREQFCYNELRDKFSFFFIEIY